MHNITSLFYSFRLLLPFLFVFGTHFRVMFAFCHMCGMSSACSNPFLYGWLNDNFRKEFQEILSGCFPQLISRFASRQDTIDESRLPSMRPTVRTIAGNELTEFRDDESPPPWTAVCIIYVHVNFPNKQILQLVSNNYMTTRCSKKCPANVNGSKSNANLCPLVYSIIGRDVRLQTITIEVIVSL